MNLSITIKPKHAGLMLLLIAFTFSLLTTRLLADDDDDDDDDRNRQVVNKDYHLPLANVGPALFNAQWKTECSSCHNLYHPGLLPQRSWHKIMNGLNKHFGENAEVDAKVKKEIADFLAKNAGDVATGSPRSSKIMATISSSDTPLRITETSYFKRKHHELNSDVYRRNSIKSAANCFACHDQKQGEAGYFNENTVKIPKQ